MSAEQIELSIYSVAARGFTDEHFKLWKEPLKVDFAKVDEVSFYLCLCADGQTLELDRNPEDDTPEPPKGLTYLIDKYPDKELGEHTHTPAGRIPFSLVRFDIKINRRMNDGELRFDVKATGTVKLVREQEFHYVRRLGVMFNLRVGEKNKIVSANI